MKSDLRKWERKDVSLVENEQLRHKGYCFGTEVPTGLAALLKAVKGTSDNKILRELKLVSQLEEHESIIRFDGCSRSNSGQLFLYAPVRMDMGSCGHWLPSYPGGFPETALGLIAKSILRGLEHLHVQGIVHRALCADNIFLDSGGEVRIAITHHAVKIADSPKWIGVDDKIHEFEDLEDVFVYLAPEVLKQDLNGYGVASDIYSVGICLCELGNGIAPFQEMDPLQILYEKLSGSTPFLLDSTTCNDKFEDYGGHRIFAPALHDLVNQTLQYNPELRSSASELLLRFGTSLFKSLENTNRRGEVLAAALPLAKKIL